MRRQANPFLAGMLTGSLAFAPATLPMAHAQDDQAGDAIVVYSAGIDGVMSDTKDSGLRRALGFVDERLLELPREMDEPDMPAPLLRMGWELLANQMTFRLGMLELEDGEERMPYFIQLTADGAGPGWAKNAAATLNSIVESEMGQAPERDAQGMSMVPSPVGMARFGALREGGRDVLMIAANDEGAPPYSLGTFDLPEGVRPAMAMKADLKKLQPLMEMVAQQAGPEGEQLKQMFSAFGLWGDNALVFDAAYGYGQDRSYGVATYYDYADLAAQFGIPVGKSIGDATMRLIPSDSTYAQISLFDIGKLADWIRDLAEAGGEVQDPFVMLEEEIGFNLDTDFLEHMGDTFIAYRSDQTGGGGLLSTVMMMSLDDARAFASSHDKLRTMVNQRAGEMARGYLRIRSWTHEDHTIFTLSTPGLPLPIEVSWTIEGNYVVSALSAGSLLGALEHMRHPKGAIMQKEEIAAMARLAPAGIMSLYYVDTERFAEDGYGLMNLASTALANLVRSPTDPGREPGVLLPAYNEFRTNIKPTIMVGYWDGRDLVYKAEADKSLAVNLAGSIGSAGGAVFAIAATAGLVGVTLPAIGRARATAKQVRSAAQVRQILMGCAIYAAEQDDRLPESLDELIDEGYLTPDLLHSPIGPAFDGGPDYALRGDLPDRMSEIRHPSRTILAIDRAAVINSESRFAVGFVDGHVETHTLDGLMDLLQFEDNHGAAEELQLPEWIR